LVIFLFLLGINYQDQKSISLNTELIRIQKNDLVRKSFDIITFTLFAYLVIVSHDQ